MFSFFLIRRYADIIIVDNSLLEDELKKLGFNSNNIYVNYPGLNIKYLQSLNPSSQKYTGIFMAQLRKSKGLVDLIRIWKNVCDKVPNATLGIIGKGTPKMLAEIKEKIKNLKLTKHVDILGFQPDDIAFSLIRSSKVFLFPSYEEGFGIAPLEAQILGVPVVAYDLPVFEEIFPNGMIKVAEHDIINFSKEVTKVIKNKDYRSTLSREAVKNARRYNWYKTARIEQRIFDKVIKFR